MKGFTWIEALIVFAIVAILLTVALGIGVNKEKFTAVCDAAKGTTVWDGRQYQCIKQ